MSVKLLTEHNMEFLSLKGDCTGSSESTLVKIPHCWKSRVTAHMCAQREELDQHSHLPFLIRTFTIRFIGCLGPNVSIVYKK